MKDQYVGDIGDYGKYGLLRFLSGKGIRLGINWYRTENDGSNDGKFIEYLKDTRKYGDMQYDEELFNVLGKVVKKCNKSVTDIEKRGIIPYAVFFNDYLSSNPDERITWHKRAKKALLTQDINLVFADPDNGTFRDNKPLPRKNSEKYASLDELREYYDGGKDVVYYCHRARRKDSEWMEKMNEFNDDNHNAKIIVLTFHRGTQRSYIFAIHPEKYSKYDAIINEFVSGPWGIISVDKKKPPFNREL